jgi:arabinose-5-phosphate isomerase
MSAIPHRSIVPATRFEQLREARDIIRHEAAALHDVAGRLDERFCDAVDLLLSCQGRVVVTGIGKAGLIGRKIAATLSSTGTRSQFLHPAEAVHGDLGCLARGDVVLALSNSGETDEVCRLTSTFRALQLTVIALTSTDDSTLASNADVTIPMGRLREVDANGLAPSTTTTVMLAIGDALALVVSRLRQFSAAQFAVFHPGGSLGQRLKLVADIMRPRELVRIAFESASVREVFTTLACPGRRCGAVMVVDAAGRLTGIFTDSDLARLLESRRDDRLDSPIHDVMTRQPLRVHPDDRLGEVIELLADHKISELPVVDHQGHPVGLVDITDVIGVVPAQDAVP